MLQLLYKSGLKNYSKHLISLELCLNELDLDLLLL